MTSDTVLARTTARDTNVHTYQVDTEYPDRPVFPLFPHTFAPFVPAMREAEDFHGTTPVPGIKPAIYDLLALCARNPQEQSGIRPRLRIEFMKCHQLVLAKVSMPTCARLMTRRFVFWEKITGASESYTKKKRARTCTPNQDNR